MKPVTFVGTALDDLRAFPDEVRREAGYQLDRVQRGLDPDDWKPMRGVGPGVREVRLRDQSGAYRVIYLAALGRSAGGCGLRVARLSEEDAADR